MEKATEQPEKKLYFGGLDSLRLYAFLIVFISHSYFSFFDESYDLTRRFAHGEMGVHMFFVLSAFLITYLSLREYGKTGGFSLLHFFKKRILRIWPLYFLVVGASYVWHLLSGPEQALGCTTQFLYFFGNFCAQNNAPDIIGSTSLIPMWSISVEQQFYTVFPLLLLAIIWLRKRISKPLTFTFVFLSLVLVLLYSLHFRTVFSQNWNYISYATASSLPGFVFGIVLAFLMYKNAAIIGHVRKYAKTYAITAVLALISGFKIKFHGAIGVSTYILPIIYSTLIYIILATENSDGKKTPTQYLGQISYGLYAYHMFAVVFVQYLAFSISPWFESLLALGITIVLAHLSFKYFESWFLKFK